MDNPGQSTGGKLGEYASYSSSTAGRGDRPLADVLKDIIGNVQDMVRSEVRLAKAEVREEATKSFDAAKMLMAGAVLGIYGGLFIFLAAVYALSLVVPAWAAALIVGVVLCGIAGAMVMAGRERMKHVNPTPERTVESIKENVEWMKNQTKS